VGPVWALNNVQAGTFQEWGAFVSSSYDGGLDFGAPETELSALFTGEGNVVLGGGINFWPGGSLTVWSGTPPNFASSTPGVAPIYGADDGIPIATFVLTAGTGAVDPNGIPNGLFTLQFQATAVTPGYFFMPDGVTDMAGLAPALIFGYSTTNASWVQNPNPITVNEIVGEYANKLGQFTNVPPNDLIMSTNGQYRLSVVPVPATLILFGSGLVGLVGFGKKRLAKRH